VVTSAYINMIVVQVLKTEVGCLVADIQGFEHSVIEILPRRLALNMQVRLLKKMFA